MTERMNNAVSANRQDSNLQTFANVSTVPGVLGHRGHA